MTNEDLLAALAALPDADMLTESKITDPLGSGEYYSARTVVSLLAKERERCAALCEDVAGECDSWEDSEEGQGGSTAANLCATRIRKA